MSLTSSIPVLRVLDYARARAFWRDGLGFKVMEEAGVLVTGFGIFRRGAAQIFLIAWDGPEAAYAGWRAYFHTDDLAGLAETWRAQGLDISGPRRTEYGMDEIEVTDPEGNTVCFGQDAG